MKDKVVQMSRDFRYPLSPYTLAIMPMLYGSKLYSRILVKDKETVSAQRPLAVIKKSCLHYGTNFKGCKEAAKFYIGVTHKPPIGVNPSGNMYFFPTESPSKPDCIWIAHNMVDSLKEVENGITEVIFKNGVTIEVPVSLYTVNKQMYRTFLLSSKIGENLTRWNYTNQHQTWNEYHTAAENLDHYNIMNPNDDFNQPYRPH